jgi:hypothetical protein
LTARGQRALLEYGVRTIIDLRGRKETREEPSAFAAGTLSGQLPTYANLPLDRFYPAVSALIGKATTRAEVYCIILDHYPDAVSEVMREIVDAQPGGIVIHCHSGTDRTGIVSGLLLSLAGVPDDVVAVDYAESHVRLLPLYEKAKREASSEDRAGFWYEPITPEMMYATLAHLRTAYGGVLEYLRGTGLSPVEIEHLKSRLCAG